MASDLAELVLSVEDHLVGGLAWRLLGLASAETTGLDAASGAAPAGGTSEDWIVVPYPGGAVAAAAGHMEMGCPVGFVGSLMVAEGSS